MDNTQAEELREKILTLGPCIGPYETPHRCSSLHCDHCGICDISEELIALLRSEQNALLDAVVADAPKDKRQYWQEDMAYSDGCKQGFNDANAEWRATVQRHKVKERE